MRQRRDRFRFALEAQPRGLVVGKARVQHLDGHFALEPRVERAVHLAHPALADGAQEVVVAETAARGDDGTSRGGRHARPYSI